MLSEAEIAALHDVARNIDLASQFIQGFDLVSFRSDLRTLYAVTRCLEIISEASRRLSDDLKARHPLIGWKNMAGAGNIYRHDYEDVDPILVWEAVLLDLPPLKAAVQQELISPHS